VHELGCPCCGAFEWSAPLGSDRMRPGMLVLGVLDPVGEATLVDGIEVEAAVCEVCGFVRLCSPGRRAVGRKRARIAARPYARARASSLLT